MRARFVLGLLLALALSGCDSGVPALAGQGSPAVSPPGAPPVARFVASPTPAPTWTPDFRPRPGATRAPTATPVTVPLSLTAEDMGRIRQAVDGIGFFGYPAAFKVHTLFGSGGMLVTPSDHYLFQVREGARQHAVYWDDNIPGAATRQVNQLPNLAALIERTAERTPAVAALPPFMPGCA